MKSDFQTRSNIVPTNYDPQPTEPWNHGFNRPFEPLTQQPILESFYYVYYVSPSRRSTPCHRRPPTATTLRLFHNLPLISNWFLRLADQNLYTVYELNPVKAMFGWGDQHM